MRRRAFITLAGGAAIGWPLASRAQRKAMPVIGFLTSTSVGPMVAFSQGLGDIGYVEGQNLAIEYRSAEGHYDRLPSLAADLVERKVDVIVVGGNLPAARAAKGASATIPVVFVVGVDPVASGLVDGLARPGGNLTGFTVFGRELHAKRLELLCELAPQARTIGYLVNPANPASPSSAEQIGAEVRKWRGRRG